MAGRHQCPTCDTGVTYYYACRDCKRRFDEELGEGWEKQPWFKMLNSKNNHLMKAERLEGQFVARLNEGNLGVLEAHRTVYERAVDLIRGGTLEADVIFIGLTSGKGRVNRPYYRRVIARALADLADELGMIRAERLEDEEDTWELCEAA